MLLGLTIFFFFACQQKRESECVLTSRSHAWTLTLEVTRFARLSLCSLHFVALGWSQAYLLIPYRGAGYPPNCLAGRGL